MSNVRRFNDGSKVISTSHELLTYNMPPMQSAFSRHFDELQL